MFDWECCRADPQLEEDLGYRIVDWDVLHHQSKEGRYVFLPADENLLHDEAFVIACERAVCDLLYMV